MTGYQRPLWRLTFGDLLEEFEGLEIVSHRLTIGDLYEVTADEMTISNQLPREEFFSRLARLCEILERTFVSWNLETKDGPVPLTGGYIAQLDWRLLDAIVNALVRQSTVVRRPLSTPSVDGSPSVEGSMTMEELLASQPSSSGPSSS